MTCPDRPHDLDLLLAGEPVDESVRQHATACEACAEEVALDAAITGALRSRRAVTAPPDLIATALAEAKRDATPSRSARLGVAAARPAVQRARPVRLRIAGVALLAVLLLAALWVLDIPGSADLGPEAGTLTAEDVAPEASETTIDPIPDDAEAVADDEPEPTVMDDAPEATPPAVAPRRSPARPRSVAPAPQRRPVAPAPEEAPEPDNLAQNTPEAEPSPEEVAQAEADLKLAFALVSQHARQAVTTSADAISPTLDHALPFAP